MTLHERLTQIWETPDTLWGALTTVDHKVIGVRYLVTALVFLGLGGLEALLMRVQLSRGEQSFLTPEAYDQIFTMHGVTMIFWYASPILSGFGNYLVPLLIGARDMAFPRVNAFSYWSFLLSGVFLYGGWLAGQAPHGGWFAYAPYTSSLYSPGYGIDFYVMALIFLTISTTAGAINFIVTILRLRAPGMTVQKMPLILYSTLTTSFVVVLSLPALTVACLFLELDRRWGTHFFGIDHGGDPLLWQQLFWFFGHPWVYVVFLPATGMISMLLPVFARRPITGYGYVAASTVLTGVAGFTVWVHHMFAAGAAHGSMAFFSAASMVISIFSTVQVFAWIATLWNGRPVATASLHFALGFLALLMMGGLSGVVTALIPVDWQLTDTYFVVAHLHYVLIGANVFPVFAAFYYWLPKITGHLMDERLGKLSFWTMFIGFNAAFFPMHVEGLLGMPRRIYTYPLGLGWDGLNFISTLGAALLGIGILINLWNFAIRARTGASAGPNPWNADTLEWFMTSPPPVYAWLHIPTVASKHPGWDQYDEQADPGDERIFAQGRVTLATTWSKARPIGISKMPEDTITPLLLGLALTALFSALIVRNLASSAIGILAVFAVIAVWLWPQRSEL